MANQFRVKKGLIVNGSGSTILDIQGSQGQLFSVTDSLSGSLFAVKDISGIPVLEAFSDNRVNIGTFNQEAIKVLGSTALLTGSLSGSFIGTIAALNQNLVITGSVTISGSQIPELIVLGDEHITGSLRVTNGIVAQSFTGSLLGSASYSLTASYAINAGAGAGFPFSGSAVITGSLLVTELSGSGVRLLAADAEGKLTQYNGSLVSGSIGYIHSQSSAATNWQVSHSLGTESPIVTVYDSAKTVIIPTTITITSPNALDIVFNTTVAGYASIVDPSSTYETVVFSSALVYKHTQSTLSTNWSVLHNLNSTTPIVTVYDGANKVIIPQDITSIDANNLLVTFSTPESGSVAVIGNLVYQSSSVAISASTSITSSYAFTASYALNAGAGGGSFPFTGSAIISGSLDVVGDIYARSGSSYVIFSQSIFQPQQSGSQIGAVLVAPKFTYSAPLQTQTAFKVLATFSGSSIISSSQSNIIADFGADSVGSQFVINDVTSGSIYMVNDVSGLPIIEANSDWDVFIYDYPNVVLKKTGSMLELGVVNNTASFTQFKSDLVINEGLGFSYRQSQASGSTIGAVTSSIFSVEFGNVSSSVLMHAVVTGWDTGSNEIVSGDVKASVKYKGGVASIIGTNTLFINADADIVGFDILASSTSASLQVYGTGSRVYRWGATITTQTF